jgi:hypothetical protein
MKDRVRLALEALAEMSTPRALDLMVESLRQRRHAKIYPNLYRAIARKLSRLEPEDASRLPEVTYRHLARFVRLERRVENGHDGSLELCLAFCEGLERWNPEWFPSRDLAVVARMRPTSLRQARLRDAAAQCISDHRRRTAADRSGDKWERRSLGGLRSTAAAD